jgi:hypothetical protein
MARREQEAEGEAASEARRDTTGLGPAEAVAIIDDRRVAHVS